jgi:hypothetical protein
MRKRWLLGALRKIREAEKEEGRLLQQTTIIEALRLIS